MSTWSTTARERTRVAPGATVLSAALCTLSLWTVPAIAQERATADETSAGVGVRLLESHLRETEQRIRTLDGRMPKLREEAQDLINQLSALTRPAAPPHDDEEGKGTGSVKKVLFRPPLGFVTKKEETPLGLAFQGNRVRVIDLDGVSEAIKEHVAKEGLASGMVPGPRGDYDAKISVDGGSYSIELIPKSSSEGEKLADAIAPSSGIRTALAGFDPNTSMLQCLVYPDSFEIFREVRANLIWEKNIETGWVFQDTGKPIYLGGGRAVSQGGG